MRNSFIKTLMEQARQDDRIFLLCGDLGYSVLEPFAEAFPDRFINVGIAEQNMVGLAAGLSLEGYTVFCYSIGNFPTLRAMEQIRYDVAYHDTNVKIIAVGGGYAYGPLSTSHHTTEELGMLRTIPNMVVTAPGDPAEVDGMTAFIAQHRGPCYMRLNKAGEPRLHAQPPALTLGGIVPVHVNHGATAAVFATGDMVGYAARYLEKSAPHIDLYSFPFVNPIDTAQLAALAARYTQVAT
ncbi:MAG TPA: transketolase, partial [Duganella sp.]|uniref:transketolase family protein n=1 Tax=Duganella sp. TaxID=1904440 RepID=UPI002ED17C4D